MSDKILFSKSHIKANKEKSTSDKDYSGCEHKDNEFCSIAKYAGTKCKNNLNCYYKQLQAKSDECEGLRREGFNVWYEKHKETVNQHDKILYLQQENTALKQQIEEMKNTYEVDENGESLLVFNLSKIIADKKLQLDYVQNNLNSAVEALEKMVKSTRYLIKKNIPMNPKYVLNTAKTALDKVKTPQAPSDLVQ